MPRRQDNRGLTPILLVDKFLMQLEEQLHARKVDASFSEALRQYLAKHGFKNNWGQTTIVLTRFTA
jgi:ATP-dependent Clp protease ATP-binding subunit ClpA